MATKRQSHKLRKAPGTAQQRMLETMHQIWLAGLGAVSKAGNGAPQLLQELVAEGARVQSAARGTAEKALGDVKAGVDSRVAQIRRHAGDAMDDMERIFQTRVQQALGKIGVPSAGDVESLGRRVEKLNANVNKLAGGRKGGARHLHAVA